MNTYVLDATALPVPGALLFSSDPIWFLLIAVAVALVSAAIERVVSIHGSRLATRGRLRLTTHPA